MGLLFSESCRDILSTKNFNHLKFRKQMVYLQLMGVVFQLLAFQKIKSCKVTCKDNRKSCTYIKKLLHMYETKQQLLVSCVCSGLSAEVGKSLPEIFYFFFATVPSYCYLFHINGMDDKSNARKSSSVAINLRLST